MEAATEEFLDRFFAIERALRRMLGGREEGFSRLLTLARQHNAVVRRYEVELRAFNELRNMLVHGPLPVPVAQPSQEAVETLARIHHELISPEGVLPRFAREVVVLRHDHTFAAAMTAMRETGFSQFPVYRGRHFIGLLTDGLLARWLAHRLDGDFEAALGASLADVLQQVPERSTVVFVGRKAVVPEVREMFEEHLRRGRLRLDAVIVTEAGQPDELPLGIITPKDAVALVAEEGGLPARSAAGVRPDPSA